MIASPSDSDRTRGHPAALPTRGTSPHPAASNGGGTERPRPRTIEEAKLNLRLAARAPRHGQGGSGSAGSGSIVGDIASGALRLARDHPGALAAGIGVLALAVGPGKLLKGAATVARLATVAGFLGKAAK